MVVHVDQAPNHELAGEVDHLRAGRDFARVGAADGGDATTANDDRHVASSARGGDIVAVV